MTQGQIIGSLTIIIGADTKGLLVAQTAIAKLTIATTTAATKMTASLATITANINSTAQRFRTFGYLATAALTVPIVMAGKSITKLAMDYEFAMGKVAGLTNIGAEGAKRMSAEILRMAPEVAQSPLKLAESLYYVATAGLEASDIMKVVRMSALAASAGMGEAATISKLLIASMNAYAKSGMDAARVMDIFTAGIREGLIEPEEFASSLGSVISIASEAGAKLEEVVGLMSAMSLTGTSAAKASTYLRNVFTTMMKPAEGVKDKLKEMGTSAEYLRWSIKEKGLLSTLTELRELIEKNGKQAAEIFPNIRGLMGFLKATGENADQVKKAMDGVSNSIGSFGKVVEVQSKTLKWMFGTAAATAQVALISLGQSLGQFILPLMKKLVGWLEKATEWFNSLSETGKNNAITFLAFTAVLGPASLAISLLMYAASGLLAVFGKLFILMATSPWGAAAVAVGLLASAIVIATKASKEYYRFNTDYLLSLGESMATQYDKQSSKINDLISFIEDETIANSYRKKAIEELKTIIPGYNALLTEEGKLINNNKIAIDAYVKSLWQEIKLNVYKEQAIELIKKQVKNENDLYEAIKNRKVAQTAYDKTKGMENIPGYSAYGITSTTNRKFFDALQQAITIEGKLKDETVALSEAISFLEKQLSSSSLLGGRAAGAVGGVGGVGGGAFPLNYEGEYDPMAPYYAREAMKASDAARYSQYKLGVLEKSVAEMKALSDIGADPYKIDLLPRIDLIKDLTKGLMDQRDAVYLLTDSFTELFSSTGKGFQGMVDTFIEGMKRLLAEMLAIEAVAMIFNMIVPGSGTAFKIASGRGSLIPLASGGIAYGSTLARVGEYAGASSNPEVIAPLSKLKSLLGGSYQKVQVEGMIYGKDLKLIMRRS